MVGFRPVPNGMLSTLGACPSPGAGGPGLTAFALLELDLAHAEPPIASKASMVLDTTGRDFMESIVTRNEWTQQISRTQERNAVVYTFNDSSKSEAAFARSGAAVIARPMTKRSAPESNASCGVAVLR